MAPASLSTQNGNVGAVSGKQGELHGNIPTRFKKKKQGDIFDAARGLPGDPTVRRWFNTMQEINEDFLDNIRKSKSKRVKIAILDTGIDMKHLIFRGKESRERIKACENFLDDGEVTDLCGHGTHCVGLVRTLAPEADIYVARCVRDFESDLSGSVVSKAIRRASRREDEGGWDVDIISLSLGFYSLNWEVENAVSRAIGARKLIFVAASNNGLGRRMTFPAWLPGVICVNATDGNGRPLRSNPSPVRDNNLAILGENVESAWKCELGSYQTTKIMTGTSVATPIAASVAALMLEIAFTANGPARKIFHACLPYMRLPVGMTAILKDMAREGHEFYSIFPGIRLDPSQYGSQEYGGDVETVMLKLAHNTERVLRDVVGVFSAP